MRRNQHSRTLCIPIKSNPILSIDRIKSYQINTESLQLWWTCRFPGWVFHQSFDRIREMQTQGPGKGSMVITCFLCVSSWLQVRLRSVRWYRLSLYWSRSFMIIMVNPLTSLERQVTSKMMLGWSYLPWFLTSISIKAQLQLHHFTGCLRVVPCPSPPTSERAVRPGTVFSNVHFGSIRFPSDKTSIFQVCFLGIPFSW